MVKFIIDLLTSLGLGINANIGNFNTSKVKELFPNYNVNIADPRESEKTLKGEPLNETIVSFTSEWGNVLTLKYTHTLKGRIVNVEPNELLT